MPESTSSFAGVAQGRHGAGFYSLVRLGLFALFSAATSQARPLFVHHYISSQGAGEPEPKPASDPALWAYLGTAMGLVLLGGAFAGLTIALMGQDEVYLQVISESGEGAEKKHATKVLRLLKRGKHWVLVTLLVGNVITNETLPLVLDRSIGGGLAAAVSSTVLVIIFGEIVPQSICVRYGLPVGAWCSPLVLILMWIFAPITWPVAKLLDYLLGADHGTTYKKAGLKTLVTLHKTIGSAPGERLNEDEVAIISGVLDLKAKPVGSIMTPMNDVFTLSADDVLDEDMIEIIMREGYSRIPIHNPRKRGDFVGMLLVKMLITYDPEDARKVSEFALATLPETRPDTSCLDIINFFQEGKSHMVLVSDYPGESYGALGVVTLEDVIEELIGEEIIDESDVFVDVHKAIRRMQPAPTHRHRAPQAQKGQIVDDNNSRAVADERSLSRSQGMTDGAEGGFEAELQSKRPDLKRGSTASAEPRQTTFLMRRPSSVAGEAEVKPVKISPGNQEMKQQLRSLGPSNVASRPKQTRINTVKVKPGMPSVGTIPENKDAAKQLQQSQHQRSASNPDRPISTPPVTSAQAGIGEDLVDPASGANDGVQALHEGYGTLDRASPITVRSKSRSRGRDEQSAQDDDKSQDASTDMPRPEKIVIQRSNSHSTLGSLHSRSSSETRRRPRRHTARSGSITENVVESGGIKKLVLEPSSSDDETNGVNLQPDDSRSGNKSRSRGPSHSGRSNGDAQANGSSQDGSQDADGSGSKPKKKRRGGRNRRKKGQQNGAGDENTPLLSREG